MFLKKTAVSLGAILFLLGCGRHQEGFSPSKPFVIATSIPIGEVKPFTRIGIGASLVDLLYRKLVQIDAKGQAVPDLASEFHWENGGRDFRVKLAEGRARDVEFTFNQIPALSKEDFLAFGNLKKIEVISDYELVFHLERFDRAFLTMLGDLPILREKGEGSGDDFFIFSQNADEIVLKRKVLSKTKANEIIVKVIPNARRAIRELVAGNVDFLLFVNDNDYKILSELPEIELKQINLQMIYMVLNNEGRGHDSMFWRKLNSTIRRDEYLKQLGETKIEPAFHSVPRENPWWSESLEEGLAELQSEHGSTAPVLQKRTLSFLSNFDLDRRVARILKRQLKAVEVELQLEDLSPQGFQKKVLKEKEFDLLMMPYNMKHSLTTHYLIFHSAESENSANIANYSNPEVDLFLEKSRYAENDEEARAAFTQAIQAILKDPPGLFLFWLKSPVVYRKACSGFNLNSTQFFSSLKDVRCEPSAVN